MIGGWQRWCALTAAWIVAACSGEGASPDAWAPSDIRDSDTDAEGEAGGETGEAESGWAGEGTDGSDTSGDTGSTPEPEEDRWCLYQVVPSGGRDVLHVRDEPDPNASVQYTLEAGDTVWGSDTVVNGHRDLNRSLGIPQWGQTSMLVNTDECEDDDDTDPPPAADPLPQGFQLPFPCDQEWRLDSWASNHAPALDMVREPDQHGTDGAVLVAPADGVVNMSFYHENAGHTVQIDHGERYFTTYIHLQSRAVSVGDEVERGQQIGAVGKTGPTSNGHPHLHFELAYDANADGQASWGSSNSERIPPWFDGVEYSQAGGLTYRFVRSNNCD